MAALNDTLLKKTNSHKLVFLGDSAVGKSCIVSRFVRKDFSEFQEPTIGAAFNTAIVDLDEYKVRFEIWDTAGQERYRSLAPMYYRGATVAIIVYDLTCRDSYKGAMTWIAEIKRKGNPECVIALVGNKYDLEKNRKISKKEAVDYCDINNVYYLEVSAKTNYNIDNLFRNVARRLPRDINTMSNVSKIVSFKPKKKLTFCNLI